MTVNRRLAFVSLAAWLIVPSSAHAQQPFESVGTRALGMGGAFVGVANDASAVYWNPAGLVTARPGGVTIEWTRLRSGNPDGSPQLGDAGQNTSLWSLGTWPIGLFYGKIRSTELVPVAPGVTAVQTLQTREFGATLLQTLTRGVVLGTSLKYVRGGLTGDASGAPTTEEALDQGLKLSGPTDGAFDFDVGLMIDMEHLRIGVTGRHLRQPQFFDAAGNAITLQRQVRAGFAVLPTDGLTLALDMDLDTVDLRGGLRRMIAAGGEHRLNKRLAIRGGVRWNVKVDDWIRRPTGAAGVSVTIRPGLFLDGFYTQGRFDGDRGFGFGLRAGS